MVNYEYLTYWLQTMEDLELQNSSIGVSIPSLKHAFINISVAPKCTYFIGFFDFKSWISLLIIFLFMMGILA